MGELYDFKVRKGKTTWGLRNRLIRSLHLIDAPFSSTPFARGVELLNVTRDELKLIKQESHPAISVFDDRQSWQNPHLKFGGVKVPSYGLKLDFKDQRGGVKVTATWR